MTRGMIEENMNKDNKVKEKITEPSLVEKEASNIEIDEPILIAKEPSNIIINNPTLSTQEIKNNTTTEPELNEVNENIENDILNVAIKDIQDMNKTTDSDDTEIKKAELPEDNEKLRYYFDSLIKEKR